MVNQKLQKLFAIIYHKFRLLQAVALQLNDLIVAQKLLEERRNISIVAYICARKNNLIRKKITYKDDFFADNREVLFGLKNAELNNGGKI